MSVTMEQLESCGGEGALRVHVGKTLARLWSARGGAPLPVSERGLMWVLVERGSSVECVLARGLIWPLRWVEGQEHDARLPAKLCALADAVRVKVGVSARWGLTWGPGIDADLRGLDEAMSWGSAWTTLAAGLIVASQGGRPDVQVVATAAYDVARDEAVGVKGIEAKLGALAAVARHQVAPFVVFVAASNVEQAREVVERRGWDKVMQVEAYPVRSSVADDRWSWRTVLQPHLDRLAVPPDDPSKLVRWINDASLSFTKREAYYMEIVDELAARLRAECGARIGDVSALLVAVGDRNFNQAALLTLALRPARVIIVHNDKSEGQASAMRAWLRDVHGWSPERSESAPLSEPPTLAEVELLCGALDEDAVVDITAGTRLMLWAMTEAGRRGGARRTYISHKNPGRVRYGEERLLIHDEIFKATTHQGEEA